MRQNCCTMLQFSNLFLSKCITEYVVLGATVRSQPISFVINARDEVSYLYKITGKIIAGTKTELNS
jgi:hypothetical protein